MSEIRQIRLEIERSQSAFAKYCGIPVRTLQEWEQGRSEPPVWAAEMIRRSLPYIRKDYSLPARDGWKVCIDRPFMNCDRIYPIQQRKVRQLIDECAACPDVGRVLVFGSSVTASCHIDSDVDLYVETSSKGFSLSGTYDFEIDLWTDRSADDRLKAEILQKGVCVYERQDTV